MTSGSNQEYRRTKVRDPYLDNARAILITLVVIGHALEPLGSYWSGAIQTWIYAFHMPAFVMITGHLSRSFRNDPRQLGRLLSGVLVPYFIFQMIQATIRAIMNGGTFSLHLWTPSWTLWFLLALFFWRLATPLLRALHYPIAFTVAISLLAPLEPNLDTTLSWGRVLSFLPFFVLGLVATPEHLERVRDFRLKPLSIAVLIAGLALSFATHEDFRVSVFAMSMSYEDRDLSDAWGLAVRAVVLLTGTVASLAFLTLTPQRRHWWTAAGKHSLTVYVLHAIILLPFRDNGGLLGRVDDPLRTFLVIAIAIAMTYALSRKWTVRATQWITNPPIDRWLIPQVNPEESPDGRAEYRPDTQA